MRVRTFLSPAEVDSAGVTGATAVVIDVIRATTTIVEALANGARALYPTVSTEEAIRLANSLGRDDTMICGERKGLKVDGFDLGNSPREFTPDRVRDKRLVMSTTNGTRAFLAAEGASRVLVVSLVNLGAAASALRGSDRLAIVCAGKEGRFALDDAVCAGHLLRETIGEDRGTVGGSGAPELDDASRAVLGLAETLRPDEDFLRSTAAGRALVAVGLDADLSHCARRDLYDMVPEMHDRTIRLPD